MLGDLKIILGIDETGDKKGKSSDYTAANISVLRKNGKWYCFRPPFLSNSLLRRQPDSVVAFSCKNKFYFKSIQNDDGSFTLAIETVYPH